MAPKGLATEGILSSQANGQRQGRDSERQPQGLDHLVATQARCRYPMHFDLARADLGIISTAAPSPHLQTLPFRDNPLVLVMPLGHPLLEYSPTFVDSLAHGHVGLDAGSALALHLAEQALREGQRMHVRVRAESFDGVIRMVAGGAGMAVVSQASVKRWEGVLPMQWVALEEDWANRQLVLCARDFQSLPGYAAGLVERLSIRQGR